MYKHHIIPRHRIKRWYREGIISIDTKKFLMKQVVPVTLEEHINIHKFWFDEYGDPYDELAYRMLSGCIGKEECILEARRINGKKTGFQKGRILTLEQREQIRSRLMGNNYAKGLSYSHTEESKVQISKSLKGRNITCNSKISQERMGKGCGSRNAMSDPEKRKKVSMSKLGRKRIYREDGSFYMSRT